MCAGQQLQKYYTHMGAAEIFVGGGQAQKESPIRTKQSPIWRKGLLILRNKKQKDPYMKKRPLNRITKSSEKVPPIANKFLIFMGGVGGGGGGGTTHNF